MKWLKQSEWRWVRECGKYAVSRNLSFDADPKNPTWMYFAWVMPSEQCLSGAGRDSFDEAVADAAAHLRAQHPTEATTNEVSA